MGTFKGILFTHTLLVGLGIFVSGETINSDYHGTIREDAIGNSVVKIEEGKILVDDMTKVNGGLICGYTLYENGEILPFHMDVVNQTTGEGVILLEPNYPLQQGQSFVFEISPHDCDGKHLDRKTVHVVVEGPEGSSNTNKKPESWQRDSYSIEVEENKIYNDILQLEVQDLDQTYRDTCRFNILSTDVPFVIDNKENIGILRNTEKLEYGKQHNYILEVKAEGCGGEDGENQPLIINIKVKGMCSPEWQDFSDHLEYSPSSGTRPLADKISLNLCDSCEPKDVTVKVKLTTDHIGKGCDRDTYSIHSQMKLCGASEEIVDLLPHPSQGRWTEDASMDDGAEGDQIFYFDGKTGAMEVPEDQFNHTLEQHFTVMTWMKHDKPTENIDNKEHIMCNADGEGKNRHHYSIFVHHCKLVLLMRKEYAEGIDLNEFSPAEWRWHTPEVCDGDWHHYAISVNYPEAILYVDGQRFVESHNNPEVIDDWALHPSKKIHFTTLTIGACWMGNEKHQSQKFKGYLAGLSILNGKTENDRVLKCMCDCQEKLDFHAMQDMESGMSVAFNSEMSEITIQGSTVKGVEKLLRKVGYINTRLFPTQGNRHVKISTTVMCKDGGSPNIPDIEITLLVLPSSKPVISIRGSGSLQRSEEDFKHGLPLLRDVRVLSRTEAEEKEEVDVDQKAQDLAEKLFSDKEEQSTLDRDDVAVQSSSLYKLDSCMVRVDPPMDFTDFYTEHLKYPENLIDQLMLEAYQNENGLIISGAEKVSNYEKILRQVKYFHAKPQDINSRHFYLTCSELNGRFVSNEFHVQLSVIHDLPQENFVHQDQIQNDAAVHQMKPISHNQIDKSAFMGSIGQGGMAAMSNTAGAGLGMIIIIVVCVGFLLFMIVLGVMRIRSAHHRSNEVQMEEKPEMEWDNSALTITVNPMEQDTVYSENEMAGVHGDDSDTEDDLSDYHDDQEDLDSSDDEPDLRELKGRGLEWDESDLSKYQCKV